MSTESFRSGLFTELEAWRAANYSTLVVCTENGPMVDESTLTVWVDAELRWYGGKPVTMGTRPRGRHSGAFSLQVYYRVGEGTAVPDQIIDSLQERFRCRRLGGGVLAFGQRSVPTNALGWSKGGLFIPFYVDVA